MTTYSQVLSIDGVVLANVVRRSDGALVQTLAPEDVGEPGDYVPNQDTQDYLMWRAGGGVLGEAPPPAEPVFTRIAKADVWRRLTEPEAEMLDAALQAAPLRLRRIFEAAQYLDTTDADYPALRAGIVGALGEVRADEVLAPTY